MKRVTKAILMAAIAGLPVLHISPSNAAPADAQTNVPVREVVLFSSGVGYFEHFGQVTGNAATVLHFKTEQINDILKSLVLQDLDKGMVNAVTYPSQGPLERTLKSFQLDLTSNPSLSDLLTQLRGASITITLAQNGRQIEGTVLGVEKQQRPVGDKDHQQLLTVQVVNLVQDGGIQPVELAQVSDVKITDPELRKELAAALAAVAQARDKDKKPVEIHFGGQGERRVRIGYVVETPVWKTSYRLLLPASGEAPATQPAAGGEAGKGNLRALIAGHSIPATQPAHGEYDVILVLDDPSGHSIPATQPAHDSQQASLQGWAIVENQTDSDWKDVQLSLVSGRPISFIENLYQPLYIPRPVVQPELYASLQPQTYTGGIADAAKAVNMPLAEAMEERRALKQDGTRFRIEGFGMKTAAAPRSPAMALGDKDQDAKETGPMNPAASVSSIASAAKVGELFQYTVGNVSISRQQSAMLPIVTDPVQVHKLSIYNQSVLPNNPLLGARLKNTTGKYLLQGPITVLAGGSYAGDANIQDLPPGQERLISYGIDQEVTVHASDNTQTSRLVTGKIVKGVLDLTYKQVFSQDYTAEDKSETPKTLLIEAPRHPDWKLVEPTKPIETTDTLYRFEGRLEPHQPSKLTVKEEHTELQQIEILPMDDNSLAAYIRTGEIPKEVRDALTKAAQLKSALADTQRQIQEHQQKIKEITTEQTRIRENMKAVSPSSDYYKRLLTELDEQETTIQDLHKQVQMLQKQQDQQRKQLDEYLSQLSIG